MHETFDKLAPGVYAKLSFALDCFLAFTLVLLTTRGATPIHPDAIALGALATCGWIFAATVLRHYSPCSPRSLLDGSMLALFGVTGVAACLSLVSTLLAFSGSPITVDVLLFGSSFFGLVMLGRIIGKYFEGADSPVRNIIIVGTGPLAMVTHERLIRNSSMPIRVLGFLALPGQPDHVKGVRAPVLGTHDDLYRVLWIYHAEEVYVAARVMEHGPAIQRVVQLCEEVGIPFALPVHAVRLDRASLLSSSSASDGYLHYLTTQPKPMQYAAKRLIDILASATALLVLSPMLLTVAAVIKFTSKGPVMFKQIRVGLHGSRFNLLKFRSMVVDAEQLQDALLAQNEQSGPVFKIKHDPRITRIGRFIRKFSIDELPQLINILRGDMTIVGPRPAIPSEVEQYKPWQRRRLSVRPGLTCYWQVGGRNAIGFDEWMRLDLRYVDNWDLRVDVRLILQTFPVVLAGKGAS